MALSIFALCVFIFGAYAYGSLVILSLRQRSLVLASRATRPLTSTERPAPAGLAMYLVCTVWFILHTVIGSAAHGRGARRRLIDLAALELASRFPG